MAKSALRDKDKKVLNIVVESFVRCGRPVSSGAVSQTRRIKASPATLRNIMSKLEEMGFLSQPHTSAGRVPTDRGLRFYVGGLLAEKPLPEERIPSLVQEEFPARTADLDSLLLQACRTLADASDALGFVITPRIFRLTFEHLRFIKISDRRVLVILVTPFHMVLTETLESSLPLTQAELDAASQYIHQNFRGRTILAVREALMRELPKYRMKYEDMLNKLLELLRTSIDQEGQDRIFLQGTSRLLGKDGLSDLDKLRALFRSFEEKAALVRLLSDFISLDRVKVLIGSEANFPDIEDCSLVLSHYGYGNQVLGTLGVIGPKRIPYERIIPLVDRMAKRVSLAITVFGKEVSL
ncbi:MAG TPA: heat-inducible transcriptional repressor HrcA [Candidatus Aminicenantes bacterium]|nr:heat-inducible transcriptional repressor HrcA [Candidatus Aminicenantes bacterium]HRY65137.1 heat-inducible transcriptional repressor HrcA [Candidatus Aminicenantes bacterium]HRZ72395.1 heat-inducible transcriptional repressor HrcA [Candidatus Aminicenantes bacterium]